MVARKCGRLAERRENGVAALVARQLGGMMKDELTDRQREVYDFLLGFWRNKGYPPSIREVAGHFGFKSTRAVVDHLGALERKGWIVRTRERSRAIEFPLARRLGRMS